MSLDLVARGLARQTAQSLASGQSGQGAALVGFRSAAAAAASRTVQAKLRDAISVRDFGAAGDGIGDDTAALQAALDAVVANASGNGELVFPPGTYKLTAKLTVPLGYAWTIRSASRGAVQLVQHANNTPILSLEGGNSHSFRIEGLRFAWNTQQSAAQTDSIAIKLGSGVASQSYYHCHILDCQFEKGCWGIAAASTAIPLVWGFTIADNMFSNSMRGAIRITGAGAGQPRGLIRNNQFDAGGAGFDYVQMDTMDSLTLVNNEWLNGAAPHRLFLGQGVVHATLIGNRAENYSIGSTSNQQLITFSNSRVVAINTLFTGMLGTGSGYGLFGSVGSTISVLGLVANDQMSAGTFIGYFTNGAVPLALGVAVNLTGGGHCIETTVVPRFDADKRQPDAMTDIGDANVTLTASSNRLQYQNATLTANRTVTLPSTGLYDGMEFELIRKAATPGAFTLQVVDPLGANNHTIAASTNGRVRYRAKGGAWRIMDSGVL